jgi:hypothetical protein
MVDKTHSDGSRWLSSNCYDMSAVPNRPSLVPKPDVSEPGVSKPGAAPAAEKPRQKPIARLFEILGKKPRHLAVNPRRLGGT